MPYCSSCSKITGKDTEQDPEEAGFDVDDSGVVTGDVTIRNQCSECGDDIEEHTFNVEIDLSDDVENHRKEKHAEQGDEPEDLGLSVSAEVSRTDEMQTKDRHGKPIKRARYQRRFYGIAVSATITCGLCGEEIGSGTFEDNVQASGMESL